MRGSAARPTRLIFEEMIPAGAEVAVKAKAVEIGGCRVAFEQAGLFKTRNIRSLCSGLIIKQAICETSDYGPTRQFLTDSGIAVEAFAPGTLGMGVAWWASDATKLVITVRNPSTEPRFFSLQLDGESRALDA
jgi:hypothetical protein